MPKSKPSPRLDLVKRLGPLAFASRLKRLADRLHRDVSRYYQSQSLDFEARWFPVLYMLKNNASMAVTDLAESLDLTHPAITQIAGDMAEHGLIVSDRDARDERRHLLRLTPKAYRLLSDLEPIWADVRKATSELIEESGLDLLAGIGRIERRLDAVSMYRRLERKRDKRHSSSPRSRSPRVVNPRVKKSKPKSNNRSH